jgi:hypothetical protein
MNVSSIGSASSMTSGFLSEPPLSPGPAPVPDPAPATIPQLRTVDTTPAAESVSGSEPQAPVTPLAPAPVLAPANAVGGSEPLSPAPAAPTESPSLESTLLRMRLVTPDQIASAMREEAETGRSIAEIVVANGWVTAEDVARLQAAPAAPAAVVASAPEPVASSPEPVAAAPVAPPASAPEPAAPAAPVPVAAEPEEPAPAPASAPAAVEVSDPTAPRAGVGARVLVRLENGERIEVGAFEGFEAAKERARGLMAELQQSAEWPFLSGRYVRPEAIVSIDVDLTSF